MAAQYPLHQSDMNLAEYLPQRRLTAWGEQPLETNIIYIFVCIFLVCFAGLMSGLTLGLLSMDVTDLEVIKRTGTARDAAMADKVIPLIRNPHFLLVTLLTCNAVAMEALPIFLDNLIDAIAAILVSVTAVLIFGEIIPQAVTKRYGLAIGARMYYPVRFLMFVTSPVSYPLSKLLDWVLGGESSLFRRKELKALVDMHATHEGLGGKLSIDEIRIIKGALDLTSKNAYNAMTTLDKVFMLSTHDVLDDVTINNIIKAKPFSRLPVYRGHNRKDVVGLILVKELLQVVRDNNEVVVKDLRLRELPRLSASTPMYDMLKLFRTGRSHMAVLTQPEDREGPEPEPKREKNTSLLKTNSVKPEKGIAKTSADKSRSVDKPRSDQPGKKDLPTDATAIDIEMNNKEGEANADDLDPEEIEEIEEKGNRVVKWIKGLTMRKSRNSTSSLNSDTSSESSGGEGEALEVPKIAKPGEAIGIITIEDVIEELMQQEIVDEMDTFEDNNQTKPVNREQMESELPPHLSGIMKTAVNFKRISSHVGMSGASSSSPDLAKAVEAQSKTANGGNKAAAMQKVQRTSSAKNSTAATGSTPKPGYFV